MYICRYSEVKSNCRIIIIVHGAYTDYGIDADQKLEVLVITLDIV